MGTRPVLGGPARPGKPASCTSGIQKSGCSHSCFHERDLPPPADGEYSKRTAIVCIDSAVWSSHQKANLRGQLPKLCCNIFRFTQRPSRQKEGWNTLPVLTMSDLSRLNCSPMWGSRSARFCNMISSNGNGTRIVPSSKYHTGLPDPILPY